MTRPRPIKALTWLVLVLALLYALYLIAANALLASAWGRAQLDRTPRFSLEWERAWTLIPGQLEVTQLRLAGSAAERDFTLAAERASLHFALAPLLDREISIHTLEAEGIRQAGLDAYRLQGSGTLQLAGFHWRAGKIGAKRVSLQLDEGSVLHGDTVLVEGVALDAGLRLAPLTLAEHPGGEAARFVSGTLALAGRSDAYDVFNPYLATLGWLEIDGRGDLTGDIAIERGEVLPGSRLRLDSPRLSVRLDERHWLEAGALYRIDGSGAVEVEVTQGAHLALELDDIEMSEATSDGSLTTTAPPLLGGEGFRLALETPVLHLHAPPDELQRAELHWRNAEAFDIAAFGRYLPPPVPLTLEGGSARLQGGLVYDTERLTGGFDLTGEAISVRLGEQPLTGRLGLHLPIVALDVERGAVDVSGTRFELEAAAPGEAQPLTTALELPTVRFRSPLAWRELDDALRDEETPWQAELELRGHVVNLGVLDPFLSELFDGRGLALQGGGRLDGALQVRDGQPLPGTRLDVQSEALGARFLDFHARGDGRAHLALTSGEPHPEASVALVFGEVDLTRLSDGRRLFQAEHLALAAVAQAEPQAARPATAEIEWHGGRIPDVSVLDAYLPPTVPLRLHGGQAGSDGQLLFDGERAQGRATLAGDAIRGRLLQEAFEGELELTLELRDLHPASQRLDLSGSRLTLDASTNGAEPLRTQLVARQARLQGGFDWPGSEAPRRPLSGTLRLDGLLDRLGFLNAFLPDEHGLAIQGGGRLSADLRFADGAAAPGSRLDVHSERLAANFLHYEAFGDGSLMAEILDPGARLQLSLPRFGLRRQADEGALIEGRLLNIHSRAGHFDLPEGLRELSTHIELPHLVAPDLAALNGYLPQGGGIKLLAGQARITTHLQLEGMHARGRLALDAPDARLALHEQTLEGALHLETRLTDGDLESLDFDVSGSRLSLDGVRLADTGGSLSHGWWARLELPEGRMRWEKPLELDAQLELAMRDSGLLVNLLVDAARERRWLRERLTLGEVHGEARVMLNDDTVRLENLAVRGGERLELLANLVLRDSRLTGRAFARLGPLRLGIEIEDGRRRWQLRNARSWYASGLPASELELPVSEAWFERLDVGVE
jgi:translocation and assembly module TamB